MVRTVRNEKGVALVVALVMLVLLTILGTYALSTSSTELFIAGNYRNSQYAFYAADSGIEFAKRIVKEDTRLIQVDPDKGPNTALACYPNAPMGKTCAQEKNYNTVNVSSTETARYNITYVRTGDPPLGYETEKYVADYFVLTSIGKTTGTSKAEITLESMVINVRERPGAGAT